MLTLRIIPPRLFLAGRRSAAADDLTAFYFAQLWRYWRMRDRAAATLLAAAGAVSTRPELGGGGEAFLGMRTRKGINRLLNPAAFPLDANPLKNKHRFAERCRAAGLPIPETFRGPPGALDAWLDARRAILLKPNFSSKGRGINGYRRDGRCWATASRTLSHQDMLGHLREAVGAGAIVQDWLSPHPALAERSPGALPTLRVMTLVDERGGVEACGAVLRLSAGTGVPVDNFQAGNLAVAIDADGRCGPAYRRQGGAIVVLERHPSTQALITGECVPDFRASCDLAVRAHGALRDGFVVIGWDVGLSADGPVLIEGNWNPGTDVLQMVSGQGIGGTRIGRLYRHHLERLDPDAWRAARPVQWERQRGRAAIDTAPLGPLVASGPRALTRGPSSRAPSRH